MRILVAFMLLVASAVSESALAATSAGVDVGPLSFQLYDLDTKDGVTPWLSYETGYHVIYVQTLPDGGDAIHSGDAPGSIDVQSSYGRSSAYISITGGSDDRRFGASGESYGSKMSVCYYCDNHFASGWFSTPFVVSSNTLVVFHAEASTFAEGKINGHPNSVAEAHAYGELSAEGVGPDGVPGSSQTSVDYFDSHGRSRDFSVSNSETLTLSFVNLTNSYLRGGVYGYFIVSGIAAVPEPATYTLLSIGLVALGGIARFKARPRS